MTGIGPAFIVFGHRGAAGHEPENTLRSFRRAMEFGAPWIECDVHCADGELAVIHDESVDRTTDGTGDVGAMALDRLRGLDAGKGERVPLLGEVLDLAAGRAGVNVELKGQHTAAPAVALIAGRIGRGLLTYENVLLSSFWQEELLEARRLDRAVRLGVLCTTATDDVFERCAGIGAWSLHPPVAAATPHLVGRAHELGLRVFVYTVDDPADVRRMTDSGVDGVFTNYPDRILATVGSPHSG